MASEHMLKFLQRWVQEGKADEPVIETVEPQPPKLGLQLTADGFTGRPMPVVEFTGTLHCFVDGCDGWVEFKAGRGQRWQRPCSSAAAPDAVVCLIQISAVYHEHSRLRCDASWNYGSCLDSV